jgi:hypothetical protein
MIMLTIDLRQCSAKNGWELSAIARLVILVSLSGETKINLSVYQVSSYYCHLSVRISHRYKEILWSAIATIFNALA